MAGFTNYAFRQILRHFGGVGLMATEMISAREFLHIDARRGESPERLWGVRDEPRPLAVQVWDNDPGSLATVGARLAREFCVSVVDINFGCPVRVVAQKGKSGSYLLRFPERVGELVARVVEACRPTPVTAKIRLGCTPDTINAIDVVQAIEGAGAAAVAVHGRTAQDMFRGSADWDRIAQIKPHLRRIPLIGNGDLKTALDVVEAFRRYPVDGVMIGRTGLSRPWIFRQAQAALSSQPIPPDLTLAERRQLLLYHYDLLVQQVGPRNATVLMRKYACCYSQGLRGGRLFRSRISLAATPEELSDTVRRFFPTDSVPVADPLV